MSENEGRRLIAWNDELVAAHKRLREMLNRLVEGELALGRHELRHDLLLHCHGFCAALESHHLGEDLDLFPELSRQNPELRATIEKLTEDHQLIQSLISDLERALISEVTVDELPLHLAGISAIMESHFLFEERQLKRSLVELKLVADPRSVLGQ